MKRKPIRILRQSINQLLRQHPTGAEVAALPFTSSSHHSHSDSQRTQESQHKISSHSAPLPKTQKLLKNAQERLDQIQNKIRTEEIWKIINYYSTRVSLSENVQYIRMFTDRQLKDGVQNTTRWKQFSRVYDWCQENGYDYRLYIDYTFERCAMYSQLKVSHPPVNHVCSVKVMRGFPEWLKEYGEKYSTSGTAVPEPVLDSSWIQVVSTKIIDDTNLIREYIEKSDLSPIEAKIDCLATRWMSLSKYTLSVCPWFYEYTQVLGSSNFVSDLRKDIKDIQSSKPQISRITKMVRYTEEKLGVPHEYYIESNIDDT